MGPFLEYSFPCNFHPLSLQIQFLANSAPPLKAECRLLLTDGYGDNSASKCNGLVRERELEPWDGAATEDGLEAIEDSVVDGFDRKEVVCCHILFIVTYKVH